MLCGQCMVEEHSLLPLHIVEVSSIRSHRCWYALLTVPFSIDIQEWTGRFFRRVRLATMGLRVQLGHRSGEVCLSGHRGHKDFIVLHINGIHQVAVDFCGCHQRVDHWRQLTRFRWYPATPINPQTCATFELLRLFQTMNLQGKITAYNFYQGLCRLTDGYGTEALPVCLFPSFDIIVSLSHSG